MKLYLNKSEQMQHREIRARQEQCRFFRDLIQTSEQNGSSLDDELSNLEKMIQEKEDLLLRRVSR